MVTAGCVARCAAGLAENCVNPGNSKALLLALLVLLSPLRVGLRPRLLRTLCGSLLALVCVRQRRDPRPRIGDEAFVVFEHAPRRSSLALLGVLRERRDPCSSYGAFVVVESRHSGT